MAKSIYLHGDHISRVRTNNTPLTKARPYTGPCIGAIHIGSICESVKPCFNDSKV